MDGAVEVVTPSAEHPARRPWNVTAPRRCYVSPASSPLVRPFGASPASTSQKARHGLLARAAVHRRRRRPSTW